MEAFGPHLNGFCNVQNQLWDYLRMRTGAVLDEHACLKAEYSSKEQLRERAQLIRQTFLDSLGGLPQCEDGLNPHIPASITRDGYRIEKVIYESQPKVFVTSLLYVPDGLEKPAPAVLFVCGHGREAKAYPEYQRVCHDLARNGFVALAIDPTGQGERVTHLNPATGEDPVGWGTSEHSYQGLQCILAGTSIARYFLFDALRGIDYLESRTEVDAERIGITGNSGGGTQTSLVCMSGEPRIKAAVPCTYVTSREHYFPTGQPQDAEQIQFGMTANGINFDDFFLPFAPRPLLIGGVKSDFFPPEGTALTVERLRRAYELLGYEYLLGNVMAPGLHRYNKELREAAVNWFRVHLSGLEPTFKTGEDEAIDILEDRELWCTRLGHVLSECPEAKTPYHLNLECIPERAPKREATALRESVIEALGIRERLDDVAELYPRIVATRTHKTVTAESIMLLSEPGIHVSACLLHRTDDSLEAADIVLTPEGTSRLDAHAEYAATESPGGTGLLVVDVRGTGAVAQAPVNAYGDSYPSSFFASPSWLAFGAYCLGESLTGMRVFDVLRAVKYLRAERGLQRIGLRAWGMGPALWGYLAAALDASLDPVSVDGLIESFEAIARTELYRTDFTPEHMIHGVLGHFDLPELSALFEGRAVELKTEPLDWIE